MSETPDYAVLGDLSGAPEENLDGNVDFVRELSLVQEYAKLAKLALADEHEGNFRYYVRHMRDHAALLWRHVEAM